MSQQSLPLRSEVNPEHTWDVTSVYATPAEWDTAVEALFARLPEIQALQGTLGNGPAALAAGLETIERFTQQVQTAAMYAAIEYTVDTNDQERAARAGLAHSLEGSARGAVSFLEPELMAVGFDRLRQWSSAEPRLAHYGQFFRRLEDLAAHVRSAEVEELLGMVADPFGTASSTHSIFTNSEMPFKPALGAEGAEQQVAQGTIGGLLTNPDRELRRTAWENYADAHIAYKNTQASCLAAAIKQSVFLAKARRYPSALEAAVGANRVPSSVFHNLIETYRKNLPTWHRYWRIRRKAMGLETLHEYDVKGPMTQAQPVVPFRQAVEWICEGMAPLGEEYVSIMRRGCLEKRWVDMYANKGKGAGAYSWGAYGTHPFIFMSYSDDLFSLSTLAHELGHSLHSHYTWQTQPLVYGDYSIFVAEVASNFNQVLVRDYLFRTQSDRDFQIAMIEEAMSNFHRYFFIMPTLARFEMETHARIERNQALTADALIELMADLFAEGYGGEVEMDRQRTGITWAEFSTHLYSNFYVYQYATGISGAHALGRAVLDGVPGAADRYLSFLKAGSSAYPLEVLQRAGVDLSSPQPVEQTFDVLSSLVDRLEALVA